MPDIMISPPRVLEQVQREHLRRANHWCPYTLEKLSVTTNYSVLYWLFAMDFQGISRQSHVECDERSCKATLVENEASYPTEHVRGCTGACERYFAPLESISEILVSGGIPLIVAHRTMAEASDYIFEIEKFDAASDYAGSFAAFSHVWADGFGSITEQGVPKCQISFLANASLYGVEKPPGSTAFWIYRLLDRLYLCPWR